MNVITRPLIKEISKLIQILCRMGSETNARNVNTRQLKKVESKLIKTIVKEEV